ncbi:hypothetical protein BH24GEM2_BH24GEM2_05100 [soil metagenome]
MKSSVSILLTSVALISIAGGCSEPTQPEHVPNPPAATPPTPTPPLGSVHIAGVYDLTAPVTDDDGWGFTGYQWAAVLTLASGEGTYSDLRLLDPEGKPFNPPSSGSVTRSISLGRLVLALSSQFSLVVDSIDGPDGMGSPLVKGTFRSGDLRGEFVATRRTP